jgi:hypothetical protein
MKFRCKTQAPLPVLALLAAVIFAAPWLGGPQAAFAVLQQPTPDPNSLIGIGAVLGRTGAYPSIMQIVTGGPADRDGRLKVNDRIAGVAQGDGAFVDCTNLGIDEVVGMVRGKKGTTVRLQIIPAGAAETAKRQVIALVRAKIKVSPQLIVAPNAPVILEGLFAPPIPLPAPPASGPVVAPAPAVVPSVPPPVVRPAQPAVTGSAAPATSPAR